MFLSVGESVAEILVVYGDDFSSSFENLRYWLKPLKSPLETLDFIHLIISKDIHILDKLKECLKLIAQSNPELVNNHKYIELIDL